MWRKMVALATFGGLVVGGSAAGRVHTVRRGETLEAIGRTYGVAVPALAAANGLRDPNLVLAGTTLTIPPPGSAAPSAARPAPARIAPAGTVPVRPPAAPARRPAPAGPATSGALRDKVV